MEKTKSIRVFSFAKFQAFLGALIGLVCGVLYSFGGLIVDVLVTASALSSDAMETPGLSIGTLMAFGALIGMPIIFASFGYVLGIIEAIFYNLFSIWFGGIRIDFK